MSQKKKPVKRTLSEIDNYENQKSPKEKMPSTLPDESEEEYESETESSESDTDDSGIECERCLYITDTDGVRYCKFCGYEEESETESE